MAHFFPANSRLDTERAPSLNRRAHSRNTLREAANDSPSDSRPSRINWLQNSTSSTATTQAGPSLPRRPPSVRLGRSASLSALAAPPPALHRKSSLISNHSLQLDKPGSGSAAAAHPMVKQLSPISERSYVPTPLREQYAMDVEPTTPLSIGSSYSAFLRRPLKRSISATSTSSLRTNATPTHPPVLPPLTVIPPLDIRPVYPPVSHRVSTVYEDAGSERSSYVTARSDSDDEDVDDNMVAPNAPAGPSNSTTFSSSTQPGSKLDPEITTEGTTLTATQPSGSGSGSGDASGSSAFGPVPPARPRPRRRVTTPAGSGSGSTPDTFIWRRWTRELSFGSALSRPSFSAARRAVISRLPPLPILLFWAGFLAPWCWLIGGWLIAEGRWEDNGKARAALPLWRPRPARARGTAAGKRPRGAGTGAWRKEAVASRPQLPFDLFAKDLEQGDAAEAAAAAAAAALATARDEQAGEAGRMVEGAGGPIGGPRQWWYWVPSACLRHSGGGGAAAGPAPGLGPSPNVEKVVTFVKPYSAEVWVYRCRLAAVLSALILLTALIVALVVIRIRSSNSG